MRDKILGIAAAAVIITSVLHMSTYVRPDGVLSFLSASVRDSQKKVATAEAAMPELTGQQLFAIIQHLNKEIEAAVLPTADVKVEMRQRSTGGSSVNTSNITPENSGGDSGGGSGGSGSGPITPNGYNLVPAQDVEAKVIGATLAEVKNTATPRTQSLASLLAQRKGFMIVLAKTDPQLFLLSQLPDEVLEKIPSPLKSEIEINVSLNGKIDVLHVDDFEHHENSHFDYFFRVGKERFNLYLTNKFSAISNESYKIKGLKLGHVIVVENKDLEHIVSDAPNSFCPEPSCPPPEPDSVGEQKTLVLLINFLDSDPPGISRERVHDIIFNGKFNNFFREQSYNKTYFTGDVSGWHTLPRNRDNGGWPVVYDDESEVGKIIIDNGIDLDGYERLMLVVDWGYGGMSTVGKTSIFLNNREYPLSVSWNGVDSSSFSTSWPEAISLDQNPFKFSYFDFVFSHEAGHSLGVMHANGFDCGEDIFSGECEHMEYGNFFDTMGYGFHSLHFNAFYKEVLGWVSPQNRILITQSGRYTINPLETIIESNGQNIAKNFAKIKVPNSDRTPFYVEYRKGVGFDSELNDHSLSSNQSGLFVNHVFHPSGLFPFPRLVDVEPTPLSWQNDATHTTLNRGIIFDDSLRRGITIGPIVSTSPTSITFDVNIERLACVRNDPLVRFEHNFTVLSGNRENDISFPVQFSNSDSFGCDDSRFTVNTNILETWRPVIEPLEDVVVSPSDSTSFGDFDGGAKQISFVVPPNTPAGSYSFVNRVVNLSSGYSSEQGVTVDVVEPPTISTIQPASGPVGTNVVITGANLSSQPMIYLSGSDSYSFLSLDSNGTIINFEVPEHVYSLNCQMIICQIPTPAGIYSLRVFSAGMIPTNSVYFEVTS